jgi:hypothetical protein
MTVVMLTACHILVFVPLFVNYAECHYAYRCFAECYFSLGVNKLIMLGVIILSVIMPSVIKLTVILLIVIFAGCCN